MQGKALRQFPSVDPPALPLFTTVIQISPVSLLSQLSCLTVCSAVAELKCDRPAGLNSDEEALGRMMLGFILEAEFCLYTRLTCSQKILRWKTLLWFRSGMFFYRTRYPQQLWYLAGLLWGNKRSELICRPSGRIWGSTWTIKWGIHRGH